MKGLEYYKSKIVTLRSCLDALLAEMEKETSAPPRKRQNKKDQRVMEVAAYYNRLKKRKVS